MSAQGKDVDLLFGLDMLKRHQVCLHVVLSKCLVADSALVYCPVQQACIDLGKNALRIGEDEVPFLPEHELPEKAKWEASGAEPASSSAGPCKSMLLVGISCGRLEIWHAATGAQELTPGVAVETASVQEPSAPSSIAAATGQTQPVPASSALPANAANALASAPVLASAAGSSRPAVPAAAAAPPASRYPEAVIKSLMDLGVSREQAIGSLDACGGNADMAASMLF
ncbi:hypothetical protein BC831DRAFT_106653 [Entophlyctis helioformis]|nr:hypothetical protein BC831DRAFT_106653 [Entophlyctis helioformis]